MKDSTEGEVEEGDEEEEEEGKLLKAWKNKCTRVFSFLFFPFFLSGSPQGDNNMASGPKFKAPALNCLV